MPDSITEATYTPPAHRYAGDEGIREAMRNTIAEAARRADRLRRPILAAYTLPLIQGEPLHLYASADASAADQAWYWEQPSRDLAVAAFGVTAEWQAASNGPTSSSAAWRALLADAVLNGGSRSHTDTPTHPLGFGGFAFDSAAAQPDHWHSFPAATLSVPHTILTRDGSRSSLTVTAHVPPGAESDTIAAQWNARAVAALSAPRAAASPAPAAYALHEPIAASEWHQMVADLTATIRETALQKVVLARAVELAAERPLDAIAALRRLRSAYPTATLFAVRRGPQTFIGATPERLARVRDGRVETIALAGTAPRGAMLEEDQRAADDLRRSEKNVGEHAAVSRYIRDALTPLCASVEIEPAPHIRTLPNVLHLETTISGDLLSGRTLLNVVAALHPTPAVAGVPRADALAYLRDHEKLDRGWYAGTLGWLDAHGDGEYVVALRSALLDGPRAMLFAGCGIVADSQPEAEYAESNLKLRVMLEALGAARDEE